MSRPNDKLDEALRGLSPADVDGLTPDQVARLEGVLNRHPKAATRFGAAIPKPDPLLRAALKKLDERQAPPSAAEWEAQWSRIEARLPAGQVETAAAPRRALRWAKAGVRRYWQPLLAAAACLGFAIFWAMDAPHRHHEPPWPIRMAAHVEVNEMDVSPGLTPVLVATDPEGGIDVISLVPDES